MGFDISCKLSPMETICMKCQVPFSGKNKKNISKCCLLKIIPSRLLNTWTWSHINSTKMQITWWMKLEYWMKITEGLSMSTQNAYFQGDIRKILIAPIKAFFFKQKFLIFFFFIFPPRKQNIWFSIAQPVAGLTADPGLQFQIPVWPHNW